MDSTRIFAIRHGETAWNRDTRIQGQLDIGLNERGLAQAQATAQALKDETLAAVYSSDLARARSTAHALAAAVGAPLILDRALRERSFGHFEGHTWAEIEANWPEDSRRWRKRDLDFTPDGGESLPVFYERCVGAALRLAAAHPGQAIAIVAHGGVMDCLYRAGTRQSLQAARGWQLGNATINRLLYTGEGLSVTGWNDDTHLSHLTLDEAST
ncbi:MAG: histidine phosphatase family protein [Paucibacter sp.]|nr:histidine phosphatase family protein [Roseateles sp.]